MLPRTAEVQRWVTLLRADATPDLNPPSFAGAGFSDERGNSRPVDPFLRAALGQCATPSTYPGDMPDVRLWSALHHPAEPVEAWLGPECAHGPLLKHRSGTPIEVLTEAELCGLHALWSLAHRRKRADWAERCLNAAAWHIRELQPDNATNMPWGIHVFVMLGVRREDPLAFIEAESRLHNAKVSGGRPDRRSALILMHGAAELELQIAGG